MEEKEFVILEECPICRGAGIVMHEGGWNVQVECTDCSAHTVYVEYENDAQKAEAEKIAGVFKAVAETEKVVPLSPKTIPLPAKKLPTRDL